VTEDAFADRTVHSRASYPTLPPCSEFLPPFSLVGMCEVTPSTVNVPLRMRLA
jgi:hypothetical protein